MKIIKIAQSDMNVSEETALRKVWSDDEMEEVEIQYKKIYMTDSFGGRAYITVEDGELPRIVDIRSYSYDMSYEDQMNSRRRGFFTKTIQKLKELGYNEFAVTLQSSDSRGALSRLIEKGDISPIPGMNRGLSVDVHPIGFRIN